MLVKIPKKSNNKLTKHKKQEKEEDKRSEGNELVYNEIKDDKDIGNDYDRKEDDQEDENNGEIVNKDTENDDNSDELTAEEIDSIVDYDNNDNIETSNEVEIDKPHVDSPIPAEEDNNQSGFESIDNSIDDEQEDTEKLVSPIEESDREEENNKNNVAPINELDEINEERKFAKKLSSLSFLKEYAKSTRRQVDEVTAKLGISSKTGRAYINDYIQIIKDGILNKTYPDNVLLYYNSGVTDKDKQIKFHEVDKLRDIVKRYSRYDIATQLLNGKTLNSDNDDTFISNNSVALTQQNQRIGNNNNDLSLLRRATTGNFNGSLGPNNIESSGNNFVNNNNNNNIQPGGDIDEIHDGITALQLIRFGLTNAFGQAAKMKISKMLGNNPTPYLVDEQKMKNLLLMAGSTESRAEYFIDWLKTNAQYVYHPVGFLSYGANNNVGGPNTPGQIMYNGSGHHHQGYGGGQQMGYGGGSSMMMDDMTKYYYHAGIYDKSLPPDHPINIESLKNYKEQKREDEQMKSIDKKLNMGIRMKVLDSFSNMGQGGNGNNNSFFTPEMLLLTKMGRYERTGTDDNGRPIWSIVPNFEGMAGGMNGSNGMTGTTGNPTDQLTSMMMMMKEMMSFMQSVNKPDPTQQSFLQTIMQGFATKLLNPPATQLDELAKSMEILNRLKGPEIPAASATGAITDPNVIVETERMRTDKEFGMRFLDLKEKEIDLKRNRIEHGDREANQNLDKLIEGFSTVVPTLLEFGKNIFLGNRNGQPGMMGSPATDGQMMGGPSNNMGPNMADTILQMEYQKQMQNKAIEAEERKRAWEEELRRKQSEYNYYQPNDPYHPQPQNIGPETQKVIVQEPPTRPTKVSKQDQEFFTEETFLPHSPQEIEDAIRTADKQIKLLEHYKATAGTVLQDKIANGEGFNDIQSPNNNNNNNDYAIYDENTNMTPYNRTVEESQDNIIEQEEQQDFSKILDEYPSEIHDPDYTGPSNKNDSIEEVEIAEEQDNNNNNNDKSKEEEEDKTEEVDL